jgi:anti-sigma factor RsiW
MKEDMDSHSTNGLSDEQLADLARLVDGTLPADRRAELESRLAESPQLARIVERQSAAVDALRETADTGAPARLRARVERRRGGATAGQRRPALIGGAIAAAAVTALALVVALPGAGGVSVASAAALGQRPATQPAPGVTPGTPQLLGAKVGNVPFPNYAAKFSWKPVGARQDGLSGRGATTVYYASGLRRVAYTIVSGSALHAPSGSRSTTRGGVEFRAFRSGGRAAVTWQRGGHTCVLSGAGVRPAELLTLADWRGKGAIPF